MPTEGPARSCPRRRAAATGGRCGWSVPRPPSALAPEPNGRPAGPPSCTLWRHGRGAPLAVASPPTIWRRGGTVWRRIGRRRRALARSQTRGARLRRGRGSPRFPARPLPSPQPPPPRPASAWRNEKNLDTTPHTPPFTAQPPRPGGGPSSGCVRSPPTPHNSRTGAAVGAAAGLSGLHGGVERGARCPLVSGAEDGGPGWADLPRFTDARRPSSLASRNHPAHPSCRRRQQRVRARARMASGRAVCLPYNAALPSTCRSVAGAAAQRPTPTIAPRHRYHAICPFHPPPWLVCVHCALTVRPARRGRWAARRSAAPRVW